MGRLEFVRRAANFRRSDLVLPTLVVVLGVAIRVPALGAGLVLDDFAHMAMARGLFPLPRPAWDLFAFVRSEADVVRGVATGAFPWWTDPDLRLSFFRPLSSLLATFDGRVLGPNSALQHAHSLLWLIALIGAATALFSRLLNPRAALVAALAFAFEEGLTTPVAWVANRSALVSSTFAVLALVAWTERNRSRRARVACEVATALAILGGEYGLGVLFLRGSLSLSESEVPLRRRARSVLGLGGVFVAYAILHRAAGYRVAAFPLYRDPLTDPRAYVAWSADQARRLLQDLVLGIPTVLTPTAITTALTVVAMAVIASLAMSSRPALALALGGLAALVPLSSSVANTRLLVLPAIGMSALVGTAIDRGIARVTDRARSLAARAAVTLVVVTLAWIHLPEAALRSWLEGGAGAVPNRHRVEAVLDVPLEDSDHIVLVSAGDPTSILYFREIRALFGRPVPSDFRVLTASATGERVYRIDERTIELEMPRSGLLVSPMASIMREPSKPLPIGVPIAAGPMIATPLVAGPQGPSRMRFQFDRSLDDPTMKFLISRPTGFERFAIPAIGGQGGVAPAADPSMSAR